MHLLFRTPQIAYFQRDAQLRCALQQQVLIGNNDKRDIRRRKRQLNTQVDAYSCRFTGGNCQRQKGDIFHRLLIFFEAVFDKRTIAQLAQPVLIQLVRLEGADGDARLLALLLRAHIGVAPFYHLYQMPAEL